MTNFYGTNYEAPRIWAEERDKAKKVRDYKRLNERNMNGRMEKRDRLKAATSQCYSVSVCLCHHDRPVTVGNPEQLGPRCCTQGLHTLTDRQSRGLSCPRHITVCSQALQSDCPSNTFIIYDSLHRFLKIWKWKFEMLVLVLRNQKLSCLNLIPGCWAGHQRILCDCNWLIPHFWNMTAELCSEVNARKHNKLSSYSLLSNFIAVRRGSHTFRFPVCKLFLKPASDIVTDLPFY